MFKPVSSRGPVWPGQAETNFDRAVNMDKNQSWNFILYSFSKSLFNVYYIAGII